MPHEIIFREQYGSAGSEVVYIKQPDQNRIVQLHSEVPQGVTCSILKSVGQFFRTVFLPQGYPESVSDDYCSYQLWDTVQAFASTMTGTLTTQAIMRGVGVGDNAATPVAAAITWILKDGTGNIGRILFAWWKGTSLDADCKKWRLCADILNDIAMFLELLLPYFMGFSTTLLCSATLLKSIVGVAGGATRAALTQHQAVRNNMADVSAKDGSQETCVNLLASVFGILLLITVEEGRYVWPLFGFFTAVHLYANYRAVRVLTMSSLNTARLNIVLENYLTTGCIPAPYYVNRQEAVILGMGLSDRELCGYRVKLGTSMKILLREQIITADQLKLLTNLHQSYSHLLLLSQKHKTIFVSLSRDSGVDSHNTVEAYLHAVLLGIASCIVGDQKLMLPIKGGTPLQRLQDAVSQVCEQPIGRIEQKLPLEAIMATDKIFSHESELFLRQLKDAGWCVGGHHLGSDEWRGSWSKPGRASNKND